MPKYRYKENVGKHYHKENGKTRKLVPGDVVEIEESRMIGIKDKFDPIISIDKPQQEEIVAGLKIVKLDKGKFNVVNEITGVPINDEPLTRKEAFELVKNG